jgi:hypothetical protein
MQQMLPKLLKKRNAAEQVTVSMARSSERETAGAVDGIVRVM